jgi:hypothetical protein
MRLSKGPARVSISVLLCSVLVMCDEIHFDGVMATCYFDLLSSFRL